MSSRGWLINQEDPEGRLANLDWRGVLTWMSSWGLEVHIRLFRSWTPCNPFRIWDDANFAAAAAWRPPFHSSPGGSSVMDPNPFRTWDHADFAATAAWRPAFHSSPRGSSVMDPNPFRIRHDADFAAAAAWRPAFHSSPGINPEP